MTPQLWFDIAVLALLAPLNISALCDSATRAARRQVLDAHQQTLDAHQEHLAELGECLTAHQEHLDLHDEQFRTRR